MKLYTDPLSTSCRGVLMLVHDFELDIDITTINLHMHENFHPDFVALNPNATIPLLDDGGFLLTESSAIMKYLSLRFDLGLYPADLSSQIRVDEMVAWLSTNFRVFHCVLGTYPRMLPALSGLDPITKAEMAALGAHGSERHLKVLEGRLADGRSHLVGNQLTIADYAGIALATLADYVDFDFSPYPLVTAWMARMRDRDGWHAAFAAFNGLVNAARRERADAAA